MQLHKDRVAVLIGKSGKTKSLIESKTGTYLKIDSKSGDYKIIINSHIEESELEDILPESMRVYVTEKIIKAINFGINPNSAIKLIGEDFDIEIIDLETVYAHSEKKIKRMKGRLIGTEGKFRTAIEQYTGAKFVIYNQYITILGDYESLSVAKKAIRMIMDGAPHGPIVRFLQEKNEERKYEKFTEMWKPSV